jgi:hypothetical protein
MEIVQQFTVPIHPPTHLHPPNPQALNGGLMLALKDRINRSSERMLRALARENSSGAAVQAMATRVVAR